MKNSKDIFDLFKDNEHKLDKAPSDRAWDRLEARLDNRDMLSKRGRRAPRLVRNWLSMAGVLLVLVTCISALSLMLRNQSAKTAMSQNAVPVAFTLEEIGLYSDQNDPAYNIKAYQKQLNRLNTNPFLEGDPSKELRVQKAYFISEKSKSSKNNNKTATTIQERRFASKKPSTKSNNNNLTNNAELAKTTTAAAKVSKETEQGATFYNSEMAAVEEAAIEVTTPETTTIESSVSYDMDETTTAQNDQNDIGLTDFNWIVGKWESTTTNNSSTKEATTKKKRKPTTTSADQKPDMVAAPQLPVIGKRSFEDWIQVDQQTLSGSGYILLDDKKTFAENMRIEQRATGIFYVLSLNEKAAPREYKLKSYSDKEVVFENTTLSFPNQLLLHPQENSFTIILQNDTPMQLNSDMQQYLEQRNEITKEQIKREMKRRF